MDRFRRAPHSTTAVPTQMLPFATPEAAALDGFPGEHCRVAACTVADDDGSVVLDTGPAGAPCLYGVSVTRSGGGWSEAASGNAGGWTMTGAKRRRARTGRGASSTAKRTRPL